MRLHFGASLLSFLLVSGACTFIDFEVADGGGEIPGGSGCVEDGPLLEEQTSLLQVSWHVSAGGSSDAAPADLEAQAHKAELEQMVEAARKEYREHPTFRDPRLLTIDHAIRCLAYCLVFFVLGANIDWGRMRKRVKQLSEQEPSKAWSSSECPPLDFPDYNRRLDWMVSVHAARAPSKVAMIHSSGSAMTYAQLEDHVGALAADLADLGGVARGDLVGLLLRRGFVEIVAPLAVLRAKGAFCNLDFTAPPETLRTVCDDLKPKVVLCAAAEDADRLPAQLCKLVVPEDTLRAAGRKDGPPRRVAAIDEGLDGLCLVLFTSGSSGKPKGVKCGHDFITKDNWNYAWLTGITPEDTLFLKTPNTWAAWYTESMPALLSGAEFKIARSGGQKDPEYIAQMLADPERPVTVFQVTTQVLDIVLDHIEAMHHDLPRLRHIVQCGEPCTVAAAQRIDRSFPHATFSNYWAATECSGTWWMSSRAPPPDPSLSQKLSVGQPVPSVRVRILDAEMREVAGGEVGSIYVGGCMAMGYINQPDLTAKAFVPDPFCPGELLYDTGDLARVCDEGFMHVQGRRDRQIKLRGIRMEPEGIEVVLRSCPGVAKAVVVATDTPAILHAFVESSKGLAPGKLSEEAVLEFCDAHLAAHLRPQRIVVQSAGGMPVLQNGKVNLKGLQRLADESKAQTDTGKAIVDSLGLMQRVSKNDLEVRRVIENFLAIMTLLMVHYHINDAIVVTDRVQDFLEFFRHHGDYLTMGFVLSGAAIDGMNSEQRYTFGVREALLLYVYVGWGLLVALSGARWYLGMLLVCKVILVGMHRMRIGLMQQLMLVITIPIILDSGYRLPWYMEPFDARLPAIDLERLFVPKDMGHAMWYCVIFLLASKVAWGTKVLLERCHLLAVLAVGFLFSMTLRIQTGMSASVTYSWPCRGILAIVQTALLYVMVVGLPRSFNFVAIAKLSLGAYIVSACLPHWPAFADWQRTLVQPFIKSHSDIQGTALCFAFMFCNVAAVFLAAWPAQRLLILPLNFYMWCTKEVKH